jgi:superoxide dismutase, Cu-Zn family
MKIKRLHKNDSSFSVNVSAQKGEIMQFATVTMYLGLAFLSSLILTPGSSASAREGNLRRARAEFQSCLPNSNMTGFALLVERPSAEGVKVVDIAIIVQGIPNGKHAWHIHEVGNCTPCLAAGGHFDPGPNGNPSPDDNHPFHAGDLVNITVQDRIGFVRTISSRFTLTPGPLSLFDDDGSAFIIHQEPDTYCPDGPEPGCAGGARIACGIITR